VFLNCALLSWCCAGQFCDIVRGRPPPAPALLWITAPGVNRAAATFSGLVPDCHVSQSSCSSYLLFNFFLLFFWIYYVKSSVRLFMSTPVSPISSRFCVCVCICSYIFMNIHADVCLLASPHPNFPNTVYSLGPVTLSTTSTKNELSQWNVQLSKTSSHTLSNWLFSILQLWRPVNLPVCL